MNSVLKITLTLAVLLMLFLFPISLSAIDLETVRTKVVINEKGFYKSIRVSGKEILSDGQYPMLSASKMGEIILPKSLQVSGDQFSLTMEDGGKIILKVSQTPTTIVYEIESMDQSYPIVVFGPLKVTINEVVGEIVGVVQQDDIAFGLQSLHIKTNGGIPYELAEKYSRAFNYKGDNTDLSVASIPYYNLAAVDAKSGTVFQLSTRNREQREFRKVQQVAKSLTLPVIGPDAKIEGAKVALFGDTRSNILNRIGQVELEQGLPHPIIEGEWDKASRAAMGSYLISDFSENDFEFALEKTKKAGFKNLYHTDPFETWGHFKWKSSFVKEGDAGVKKLVEQAKAKGIHVGIHTLTNFLTTNDAYVTPIPSPNLLKQGVLTLVTDIDSDRTEIEIEKSDLFEMPLSLNALQIEDEIITFGTHEVVGDHIVLSQCTRGAFGTQKSMHAKQKPLYKLWDYPYKTLFPDLALQDEFAHRLAEIFNNTGLKQISFDGLEGSMYTGHDYYATAKFIMEYYNNLDNPSDLINDASRLDHYLWHVHTRMNWGEPWGEEMRKGQVENRIKNQEYFKRNLFPRMLGWFLVRTSERKFEATSLEDLEWALSESAGFDAGYAMTINMKTLRNHGQIDKLLEAMKNWDQLREAKAFSEDQMTRLKDPDTEWHLEKVDENRYRLHPLYISKHFTCDLAEMQPGQPGGADWSWYSPEESTFGLRLRVDGDGGISNPSFTTPKGVIKMEGTIESGQYLLLDHEGNATVTDKNYNVVKTLKTLGKAILPQGASAIAFACDVDADEAPEVVIRYITRGQAEELRKK